MAQQDHALAAALLAGSARAQALDFKPYVNARFGFAVLVPKNYRPGPLPVNGDGRTFTSPDGTTVNGSGHLLDAKNDMAADFKRELDYAKQDGFTPTYSALTRTGYTYSGIAGSRITYVRAIPACGGDAVVSVTIVYPASAKAAMVEAVGAMARSLRATRGCL